MGKETYLYRLAKNSGTLLDVVVRKVSELLFSGLLVRDSRRIIKERYGVEEDE